MAKIEDYFKCESCNKTVGNKDCDYCYGDSLLNGRIISFVRSEGLENVLAGIEIVRAMKEQRRGIILDIDGRSFSFVKRWNCWVVSQFARESTFDSPLSALHTLLDIHE